MKRDFDTWVRAKVHAQRMIDRDKDGLVRILREERGDSTSGESFRVCRFPHGAACQYNPDCPHCLKVDFTDPRTDAEIANIIIAGN